MDGLQLREVRDGDALPPGVGFHEPRERRALVRWMVLEPELSEERVEAILSHVLSHHCSESVSAGRLCAWLREAWEATR